MKPIEFSGQNVIIAKDQPEYIPLPAYVDERSVTCCWGLNWKERLQVLIYGRVWHRILTFGGPLQPQNLYSDSPLEK